MDKTSMSVKRERPDDIKKLMQEQLRNKVGTRQVDSPHAKYNSRGQLVCVVCGVMVKSAIIWQAHVNKRSHQENLTKLKQKQEQLNSQYLSRSSRQQSAVREHKRAASPSCEHSAKRTALDIPKHKGILKKVTTYSLSDDDSDDEDPPHLGSITHIKAENGTSGPSTNGLPEDFFDADISVSGGQKEEESVYQENPSRLQDPPKTNTSEVLPEGFFDDPVADAKARNVEYKDKDAEEWMSFMREVSAAEQESRIIIEEDKEEAAFTTQMEQANEQMAFLGRVVELDREKKNQLRERGVNRGDSGESQDSSDEEFAPIIWRTKNSLI